MILELERKSKEEIIEFQEQELVKLLQYLNTNSPFYKNHFSKNKVDLTSIKKYADLVKLPTTSKDDLQNQNWDFLCVDKNKIKEYCSTSGTLGTPVTIGLTKNDIDRLGYNEYISFLAMNSNAEDIYLLMLSLDRQFMAGIAYYEGARKLDAGIIRSGAGNFPMQIDLIQRLLPSVLIAVPSTILSLISYANEKQIDLKSTSVRKILCIGENIRNENFSLNELGQRITNSWNVELFSTYASTEQQTAFTECEAGKGGHLHPDLLIFEILDDDNNQLPQGEIGELTITTLAVEGMPLLRYKTGDICTYFNEPCSCGRMTSRISPIIGRKQQLIKYKGTTLYPQSIFNILNSIESIKEYVVDVFKNDIGIDEIIIHIAVLDYSDEIDFKIKRTLQSMLRVLPEVKYLSLDEIHKMQISDTKRKVNRLNDLR